LSFEQQEIIKVNQVRGFFLLLITQTLADLLPLAQNSHSFCSSSSYSKLTLLLFFFLLLKTHTLADLLPLAQNSNSCCSSSSCRI